MDRPTRRDIESLRSEAHKASDAVVRWHGMIGHPKSMSAEKTYIHMREVLEDLINKLAESGAEAADLAEICNQYHQRSHALYPNGGPGFRPSVKPAIERRWNYKETKQVANFEKSQRGIDLPKHQSYLAIHLALCDNTKPHEHPAAEMSFAEALDDARLAGRELVDGFYGRAAARLQKERDALRKALIRMVKAHADLMPCLKYGSVPDYAIQNEAPIEARAALALTKKKMSRKP